MARAATHLLLLLLLLLGWQLCAALQQTGGCLARLLLLAVEPLRYAAELRKQRCRRPIPVAAGAVRCCQLLL
jgi:hypothetical protein